MLFDGGAIAGDRGGGHAAVGGGRTVIDEAAGDGIADDQGRAAFEIAALALGVVVPIT